MVSCASIGKALSALATVTTIGIGAAIESEFWPPDKGTEAARSLVHGVILGANVWAFNPTLVPAYSHSRLVMWSFAGHPMAP